MTWRSTPSRVHVGEPPLGVPALVGDVAEVPPAHHDAGGVGVDALEARAALAQVGPAGRQDVGVDVDHARGPGTASTAPHRRHVRSRSSPLKRSIASLSWVSMFSHRERDLVELALAAVAEPGQAVQLVGPPLPLDHQAPRVGRPDRAVRGPGRAEEHLALADRRRLALAVAVEELHGDVAAELVEDLVAGVDVEVVPGVRPPDDHEDELALREDLLVRDRRLEELRIVGDPAHEMEGRQGRHARRLLSRNSAMVL